MGGWGTSAVMPRIVDSPGHASLCPSHPPKALMQTLLSEFKSKGPLVVALLAVLALRVPMITDSVEVLDSDAAINGLTLKHLLEGQWRWHYPGLHYMGVTELFLALPGGLLFGANPFTLTVAPVLAYALLTLTVYVLAGKLYGRRAANWSLVPLVFTSTDVLFWTSFPIGGHALITFWHVAALLLLARYRQTAKQSWLAVLGIWSGFGYYTYQMFLFSLVLIVPVALLGRAGPSRRRAGGLAWVLFASSFLLGWSPHLIGVEADSHDVYGSQTQAVWSARSVGVLLRECLPKFVAGPGQTGEGLPELSTSDQVARFTIVAVWLGIAVVYYRRLIPARQGARRRQFSDWLKGEWLTDPNDAIKLLVAATPPLVLAGFLLHPAVENHTHSRYLIYLMSWWPIALGAVFAAPRQSAGMKSRAAPAPTPRAVLLIAALFVFASGFGTYRYLRVREAINLFGLPRAAAKEPVVAYLEAQDSFVFLYGWYWDAYRFTFLTGEQVRGVPVQRFPDSSFSLNQFDHLRVPKYAVEARGAGRIGVIVRRSQLARWRPPSGLRPVYHDEKYLVYVLTPPS